MEVGHGHPEVGQRLLRSDELIRAREWVTRDSINLDDDYVVASEPGTDGGYIYLVDMAGVTVGYISGSSVKPGTNRRRNTLPCT